MMATLPTDNDKPRLSEAASELATSRAIHGGAAASALPSGWSHSGLHRPREVRHYAHHPLDEHQLAPMVHFMFFDRQNHFETAL
jgi:hypothetical protein